MLHVDLDVRKLCHKHCLSAIHFTAWTFPSHTVEPAVDKKKLDKQYFRCFNCFLKRCFASLRSIAERFLSKRSTITFMDTVLIAQLFHYAQWSHFAINKNCDVNYSFYEYFRNFLRLIAILGDLITWKNRLRFEEEKEKSDFRKFLSISWGVSLRSWV